MIRKEDSGRGRRDDLEQRAGKEEEKPKNEILEYERRKNNNHKTEKERRRKISRKDSTVSRKRKKYIARNQLKAESGSRRGKDSRESGRGRTCFRKKERK